MKRAYGFTIVELLIVIVVIAILAAVTVVAYGNISTRSKDIAKLASIEQFIKQIELYKAEHGDYPLPVPSGETALNSAHNANSVQDSVYFVANRSSMAAKETQKLTAFQSTYGITIPAGTLYYYDGYDRTESYAFVQATFLQDKNIPEENRSYRLQEGASNTLFPQLVSYTYGSTAACKNVPPLEATQAQSTGGVGQTDVPFFIDNTIYMNHRSYYSNVAGCNTVAYIRDTYPGGVGYTRTTGTGLFPLKAYNR